MNTAQAKTNVVISETYAGVSAMNNRTILQGDVLEKLKEIESGSIDCIITSPPYWGLRDYGVDGQLGLESDFRQYLEKMGIIMDELKRVLKKTGSCWVNLGDTYNNSGINSTSGGIQGEQRGKNNDYYNAGSLYKKQVQKSSLCAIKSRIGIPERFYINCIDSGWIARNHIPWYKSNSMPSSVKDRFTNKWESIFFFAKNQKYHFNLDAVRIQPNRESSSFNVRVRDAKTGKLNQKYGGKYQASLSEIENYGEKYVGKPKKQDQTLDATGKPNPTYKGFNERWNNKAPNGFDENGNCLGCGKPKEKHMQGNKTYSENYNMRNRGIPIPCYPSGKNPGDVFFINTKPFPESHFATFPVELPERILRCACPENGIVLDPFFGAGTVGVAAEKLNRQWVGIELNKDYIKIAEKRLESYRNDKLEAFLE